MILKIKADDEMNARIYLDGKELNRVTEIKITMGAGYPHYATITFMPTEIDLEGNFNIFLRTQLIK